MAEAQVPLAERNEAGDWHKDSTLAVDRYNRPDGSIDIRKHDPLDAVPLYGGPAYAAVTQARAAATAGQRSESAVGAVRSDA
ncbi:hypothetical protein ACWENO_31775 [Streptomyces sp. NPDC004436]